MNGIIIITGGSGFIGTHLVERLRGITGLRVVNLDIKAPLNRDHLEYWTKCDIMNGAEMTEIIRTLRPRYIAHLAARTDTNSPSPEDYAVNNVGTENVIAAIRETDSVERVLFVSTQFVVGPGPLPANDQDFRPHTAYGVSKVRAEKAIRQAGLNCAWTIVRPTNVWGSWHPRYPHEFWNVLSKGLYFHPGAEPVIRSYGYVGNVVAQMHAILSKPAELVNGKVLYVGDSPMELLDWVNAFSVQLTGRKARIIPRLALRVMALAGDGLGKLGIKAPIFSSRLRSMTEDYPTPMEATFELLGKPESTLEEGVLQTVTWLRSQHERQA